MPNSSTAMSSYLGLLAQELRGACAALPAACIEKHVAAVLGFQVAGQGFRGRRGRADLYYTSFAVRTLHALGRLEHLDRDALQAFLATQSPETIIDALSMLEMQQQSGLRVQDEDRLLAVVESLRLDGGGYAKTPGGMPSLYHSFLALLCYDLAGTPVPQADKLKAFVGSRQCEDGGFAETGIAAHGTTNATAAGLAAGRILRAADADSQMRACDFLLNMQHASGGWLAVPEAPVPDLLSTFTALLSLRHADRLPGERLAQHLRFVLACEQEAGGFSAGPWDADTDVEYTYYGLGVLALCGCFTDDAARQGE